MHLVTEKTTSSLISHELAFAAVQDAFIAAASAGATLFPAVIGHGSDPGNQFTVKSAADATSAGVKIGTYFPGNDAKGLPRHGTTVILLDQERGRIGAIVEAAKANAYRTAAADAVAAHALARPESAVLAVFGTGHQALYECLAVTRILPITRIAIVGRDPQRAARFQTELHAHGVAASTALDTARAACEAADVIVTATSSTAPLFDAAWVRPGTHVSSMGSDSPGKQELPPALLERATLFCDLPSQSMTIGELQHFNGDPGRAIPIGSVLAGRHPGRTDPDQVTVFDSSGIALQDLYVATALLAAALAERTAITIDDL